MEVIRHVHTYGRARPRLRRDKTERIATEVQMAMQLMQDDVAMQLMQFYWPQHLFLLLLGCPSVKATVQHRDAVHERDVTDPSRRVVRLMHRRPLHLTLFGRGHMDDGQGP